jgi:hypothetical protein
LSQTTEPPFTFFSASAGAACTVQARAVTFEAADAAVGFIHLLSIVFNGIHGLPSVGMVLLT